MSVLDNAIGHFAGLKNASIEVPEWGCTVYFDPPNLKQAAKWNGMPEARGQARVLIEAAKDAEGKPLFEDDAVTMAAIETKLSPVVTTRVVKAILGSASVETMGND